MMRVPFVNLGAQFEPLADQLTDTFLRVCRSGQFIMGEEVQRFEQGLASISGTKHVISVANGTDALVLALKVLGIGPGDEVVTAPNSFIASAGAIALVGADIRFADVGADYNLDPACVSAVITDKTKAIIPVHLTGNPADMDALATIAESKGIVLIEDAAQAIGAFYKGRPVGCLGRLACFSLHPLKNFHLMGDAGFISTNDDELATKLRQMRNHGLINRDESVAWGYNSRLDALQAALGNVKLPYFSVWTKRFKEIALAYRNGLQNFVNCPLQRTDDEAVYHNFVVQVNEREALMNALSERGIDTKIHYPIPLHLMRAAENLPYSEGDFPVAECQSKRIMSLPIYPELTDEQVQYVIDNIVSLVKELKLEKVS